ncbi:hypothetical protein UlMin_010614 [Ulmus minor]
MEKLLVKKRYILGWFVFPCFLLCFTMTLVSISFLNAENFSAITFFFTEFANSTVSQKPKSFAFDENLSVNNTFAFREKVNNDTKVHHSLGDSCFGKYIYVYNLPSKFNIELLKSCHSLIRWIDMCPFVTNMGLGPKIHDSNGVLSKKGWFNTNQFTLEVIFHNRMKNYKCLTNDSSLASAIFVPFYDGLDVGQYLWGFNTSVRDALPKSLVHWLSKRPEWKRMWGRVAWDFRRRINNDSNWGSELMFLPESKNMTLSIETSTWSNEFAIPYPTCFHPFKDREVFNWQRRMKKRHRPYLFIFAGAPRPGLEDSIRGELIKQCQSSRTCKLLSCHNGANHCDVPERVMEVFRRSVFCLQLLGDSYTRRSTFDSILAGCIPVFFHPGSAYKQYLWHLPKNYSKYSVFVPESDLKEKKVCLNETLLRIPKCEVLAMREEVIKLIPRIIYANPKSRLETIEDAFDMAVKGMLERVQKVKKAMEKGQDPSIGFAEANSRKFDLL